MRSESVWLMVLLGCTPKGTDDTACGDACGDSDTTAETGETGESGDTGDTTETGDTGESADSGETGTVDPCLTSSVTFEHEDLTTEDLTAALLSGVYTTLDAPGRLLVCPGTWYARLLIRADVEVVGLGATPEETILSGGESGTILDVGGKDVTLTVGNVTLDRGVGLDKEHNSGGGGIYCEAFNAVDVHDAAFTNNFANDGPAIYVEDCEVSVRTSTFADNVAEDDGGAMTVWYSNATLDDVTFTGNESLDGGAMAVFYGSATVTGTVFEGNHGGTFAGAFWLYNSTLTMSDSTFANNTDDNGSGGGLIVYGAATLDGVTFSGNSAPLGGGLFVYYASVVDGTNCTFEDNTPDDIYAAGYSPEGGISYTAGTGVSFACAENVCTVE